MLLLVAVHEQVVGVPRAAVIHLGGHNAGDLLEQAAQVGGVLLAGLHLLLEAGHLGQQDGGLELGHAEVAAAVAPGGHFAAGGAAGAALVVERIALVGPFVAVGEDGAAVAAVKVLAGLEAEAAGVAPGAEAAAAPLAEVGLAGVLDHRQLVLLRHGEDGVQVGGGAAQVHGDDRRGAVGDGGLDLARVDLDRLGVGVHEDGQRVVQQNHVHRGDEGVGGNNDLVARGDPDGRQRGEEGAGAAVGGEAVLRAGGLGVGLLEPRHVLAAAPEPFAAVDGLQHGFVLALVDDGPLAGRAGADGFAAEQGGLVAGARAGVLGPRRPGKG